MSTPRGMESLPTMVSGHKNLSYVKEETTLHAVLLSSRIFDVLLFKWQPSLLKRFSFFYWYNYSGRISPAVQLQRFLLKQWATVIYYPHKRSKTCIKKLNIRIPHIFWSGNQRAVFVGNVVKDSNKKHKQINWSFFKVRFQGRARQF